MKPASKPAGSARRRFVRSCWQFAIRGMSCVAGLLTGWAAGSVTNAYTVASEDLANPERGFYRQLETFASHHEPLLPEDLAAARLAGWPEPDRPYSARVTLVLRLFYLDAFLDQPISAEFLDAIEADFETVRAQGVKAIVRFAYGRDETAPFTEPSRDRILAHLSQLRPLLRRHADVIAVMQQGFIGAYGESYYTHEFSLEPGRNTAANWADRATLTAALLEALPADRMIQLRYVQQRQKFLFGAGASAAVPPMNPAEAHRGSPTARLGLHNDCFLADATDAGTFVSHDEPDDTPGDLVQFRTYLADESRFVVVGGETCAVNPPDDRCAAAGGRADSDLARFHYSFLNLDFYAAVNSAWVEQGCFENIRRRLGYRLALVTGEFPLEARPGGTISLRLVLENTGFAAPFNPRGLELVLREVGTGRQFYAELSQDADPRRWLPGTPITVAARLALSPTLRAGTYELLLHLPDPAPTLYGRPEYSIRLANSEALAGDGTRLGGVWEAATGLHQLGHRIVVAGPAETGPADATAVPVLAYSPVRERYDVWRARHFADLPAAGSPELDPDADGWANLAEYAVGSDPRQVEIRHVAVAVEGDAVVLRLAKPPGMKDVIYTVEAAAEPTAQDWSAARVNVLENSATRLVARWAPAPAAGFLRLKFTLPALPVPP